MNRRNVFALGLALAIGGAGSAFLIDGTVADSAPLLSLLSPPGAGYDSTNIALTTGSGGAVTFTRASTWTCQDSSGSIRSLASGKPCVVDGASLRVRSAGANNLTAPTDLSNAAWSKTNVTLGTDATLDPTGAAAQKVSVTASAATGLNQGAVVAATSATCSYVVKKGSGATDANVFILRNNTSATNLAVATLNYDTLAITHTTGSGGTATQSANGWIRVVLPASAGIVSGNTIVCYALYGGAAETAGEFAYVYQTQLTPGSTLPGDVCNSATCAAETATVATPAVGTSWCAAVTVKAIDSTGAARGLWSFGTPWTAANTAGVFVSSTNNLTFRIYDGAAADKGWTSTETISAGDRIRFCYAAGIVTGQKNRVPLTLATAGAGAGTFTAPATTYLGSLGAAFQANAVMDAWCFANGTSGCQ